MARLLADRTEDDLHEMLDEAKDDLFNLRFQSVIGQLDNNSLLKQKKKEVARILTELRMREIAQAEQLEAQAALAAPDGSGSSPDTSPDTSEADDE